ncbi:MAG: VWA domain-containing protein [Bacteroidia bacterium]|nr:VWA domain-containing protein [Bacteroidia bacterium]
MKKLSIFLFFMSSLLHSQIQFSEQNIDLGQIQEAYEIRGDIILHNTSGKKIFLMRADAERGVKVYTSKKTLPAEDTCLIIISFIPEASGNFRKKINLISSDKQTPYVITLSGNIKQVKTNDRMACVYFGKQKTSRINTKEEPIFVTADNVKRDNSNKIPDSTPGNTVEVRKPINKEPIVTHTVEAKKQLLDDHKPNNILFLVDVSSSMRDSLKLPVMKNSLHKLIDAVREIDSISFVTYASKVLVIKEAVSGKEKAALHTLVDSLKAKGMTAGSKAILVSEAIAQKHFIKNGNNQIILATDGEFELSPENKDLWLKKQARQKITLTTVAFGNDKKALKNLQELASKGDGTFIHIDENKGAEEKLLSEIEMRSRR